MRKGYKSRTKKSTIKKNIRNVNDRRYIVSYEKFQTSR